MMMARPMEATVAVTTTMMMYECVDDWPLTYPRLSLYTGNNMAV